MHALHIASTTMRHCVQARMGIAQIVSPRQVYNFTRAALENKNIAESDVAWLIRFLETMHPIQMFVI